MSERATVSFESPPSSSPTKRRLNVHHLVDVLHLLKKHGYSGANYYNLGLYLGLYAPTLDRIMAITKGDVRSCLRECLVAWLKRVDNVYSKGDSSYDTLIQALREIEENAVADGIERDINIRAKGSFASPPSSPPTKRHTVQSTELNVSHVADILHLLKKHGYSEDGYYDLGLYLGLYAPTLDYITKNNKGDASSCLGRCVASWLARDDRVGVPSYDTLIQALRELGENAVADGIERDINSKQLYHVMLSMSDSLPRYIINHYIRLLAIVNVKSDMKPDWSLSKRFLELYSTHASKMSPQVAATYVYKILTGLGYEEMDEHDFSVYLHIELEIDTKITEELGKITEFRPAVIEVVRELGPQLRDYQMNRYRMVLTVLRVTVFDSDKSFFECFTDLTLKLGKYPLAVAFTIGVLERSGWGGMKKLKPFSLPEFDLNTAYPEVDLCLTVADYYDNMSERDFSSAKVYTSSVHLNDHDVSKMSRVQFTLLLMERGALKINDVSKIEDKVRYPIFFKEYKERCKILPSFLIQIKNLLFLSSSQQVQEAIAKWLKESTVELTVKRINMLGPPGSGKTCSQRLLLNDDPPEEAVTDSTPIACRAVKATRVSVDDGHMERVDAEALLSRLAHDLMEAAAKQEKTPTEDHGTKSKEESSETETTESAELVDVAESAETTESAESAKLEKVKDNHHTKKVLKNIVDAIPEAKELDRNWVYIVDSGGQTAFQELLPLFTRAASLNIITIDLSKGLNEKLDLQYRVDGASFPCDSNSSYSNKEFLKDVLSSGAILHPIGSEEDTTAPQYPEYFVLGTRKDKPQAQENIEKYNKELRSLTSGSQEKGYRIIRAIENGDIIYPVNTMLESGTERKEEAKDLCTLIYNKISGDKFNLSIQEFVFELTLLEKANGRSFLPIEEVLPIGKSLQMTDDKTMEALKNLHNVTIILYYSEILPDKVFVDPHPILDILSRLLALTYKIGQNFLCNLLISPEAYSQEEFQHELTRLKEWGIFTQSLLEKLKDDEKFPKKDFINLLLRLHIIFERDGQGEYFIPSALPSYPETSQPPKSDIVPLRIIWRSPVTNRENSHDILPVPRGIFPLAIVNLMQSSKFRFSTSISSKYLRYRDAMSFRVYHQDDDYLGTIHIIKKQRHIEIYYEANDLSYCSQICEAVKEAITSSSEAIKIKPDGHEFAFACPSTDGCYRIVTNEHEKKVKCILCTTPPTISGEEKYWSWFEEVPGTTTQTNAAPAPIISNKKEALAQKYTKMTDELKNSIIPEVTSEALTVKSLDEVKSCLTLVCKEADWKKEVDTVTDEASLTELLQRYCFLSNFSLLKCITEKLGLKESKSKIDELAKERNAFYRDVLAKNYAVAIEDHKIIEEHHVEMTAVALWPSSETTLETFEDYITNKFKELSMFIALRAVHNSWPTFECTVPVWAIGAISLAAFGLGYALKEIILNNEVIYEAPTESGRETCSPQQKVMMKELMNVGERLEMIQRNRYRLAITVLLDGNKVATEEKGFLELFKTLTNKLGSYQKAVAFTIKVLKRSHWGDTEGLRQFASPDYVLNERVDLFLTINDYYDQMNKEAFSNAKVVASGLFHNLRDVSEFNRSEFVPLLLSEGVIASVDDAVLKIKGFSDSNFYKKFEKRHTRSAAERSNTKPPTTGADITPPSTNTVPTVSHANGTNGTTDPSKRRVKTDGPVGQETNLPVHKMHAVIDKEIAYKMDDKEFSSASGTTTTNTEPGQQTSAQAEQPPAAEKEFPGTTTQTNTVPTPTISNTSAAKEVPAPIPPAPVVPKKKYEKKLPGAHVRDIVQDICILLMTATENELIGVLGYLEPLDGRDKIIISFINGTWIYVGKYGRYSVVVGRSAYGKGQQGSLVAAAVTRRIMEIFEPKYIIAIGICFGMDRSKVNLGDVIVSEFIVDLSNFRKESGSITARNAQPSAGNTLKPLFGNTFEFKMKHSDEENAEEVKVHCSPIVSSSALVDDEDFKKQLREVRPGALAGEMEGAGIFHAASEAHHKVEAIVIKAVGDWADGKKDGCRGWKDFASHAAATYVHHHLDNVPLDALK